MARKKRANAEMVGDPFTVMFTALSIILLAFFILLNSIAVPDDLQTRKVLASLIGTFGVRSGGMLFQFGVTRLNDEETKEVVEKWMEKWEKAARSQVQLDIIEIIDLIEVPDANTILTTRKGMDLDITFPSWILFERGGVELSKSIKPVLLVVAENAKRLHTLLSIEGHTDPRSENEDVGIAPWELSAFRAASVARYLIREGGVDPKMVSVKGLAGGHPLPGGDTQENRLKNRRVVVVMKKADERSRHPGSFFGRYGVFDPFSPSKDPGPGKRVDF